MRVKILFLAATVLLAMGEYAAAQSTNVENRIRSFLEPITRKEFDSALLELKKTAMARNPNFAQRDSHDWDAAEDFVKSLAYNKAYTSFRCIKTEQDIMRDQQEHVAKVNQCISKAAAAVIKVTKIEEQYAAYLRSHAMQETRCELEARLFDAETEFPPFEFLKQSDGHDELYDYDKLSSCLLSIGP